MSKRMPRWRAARSAGSTWPDSSTHPCRRGDVEDVKIPAAEGHHGRVLGWDRDAFDQTAAGGDARDRTAMHQRAPVIAIPVARGAVDAALDLPCREEGTAIRHSAGLEVEVVDPHGFVTAVREVHEAVVGRERDAVPDDEAAVHAVHRE